MQAATAKNLEEIYIFCRHGDLIVQEARIGEIDSDRLVPSKEIVVLAGSHGGRHMLPAGTRVYQNGRDTYVQVEAATPITHDSRHAPSPDLVPNTLYKIYPQIERRGDGDVDVDD